MRAPLLIHMSTVCGISYVFPIPIRITLQCLNFTVMVSGESYSLVAIDSPLLYKTFYKTLFTLGSH